jgi:two-component system OmpR family sensor kinase
MWDTDSTRTNRLLLGGWIVSAVINVWLMYELPGRETIPFHLVWIGLSIVYGFTRWRPWGMCLALVAVAVTTGYVLDHHVQAGEIGWEETTEVPLMSALFVILVWHVHRRQQALAQVARLADSERRRAETQQLFVRLASHELRTPITIARGYAELVRARSADESIQEDSGIVLEELDKLARITQRLVTLMQIDGTSARDPVDVDAELARIVRRWEPTADRVWRISSAVGMASVNRERLEVAVDCLLENAVKFTSDGDRVEVLGDRGHDSWSVAVRDNGAGLMPEEAAALSAADGPWSRTTSGTGLGLTIARAVVAARGGRLTVSGRPGLGATVILQFPIRMRDEMSLGHSAKSVAAGR